MIQRNIVVKNIDSTPKRILCISDIHGNLRAYKNLLNLANYAPNQDRLILLGDLVEKGPKNLDTLRFIMKQCENEDVHVLMGNCDFIAKNVLYSYRLSFLKEILKMRKASLIHEMAKKIHLEFNEDTDMELFCSTLRHYYLKELSFLNDLPHVIQTEDVIYAHAAIMNETTFGTDFKEVMTTPFFLKKHNHFQKKVIVGHLPVTEYCRAIASFNPIYDADTNVYSIDGGNIVKYAGQLNCLILDGKYTYHVSVDDLKEVEVLQDVVPEECIPLFITWNHSKVQILEKTNHQCYVYNAYLNRKFWVENEFVHKETATDYTNYQIPLKKGDRVKLVFTYQNKAQIKKDGILGWTYLSNLAS